MKKLATALVALAAVSATAYAIDIPISPNAGFDTGAPGSNTYGLISNWNVESVPSSGFASGVFTSFAGYTPANGARMALLTNSGTTFVQLRNVVPVELFRMPFLNFKYAYLTTDPTTTLQANLDQFRVVVDYFSDAAGLNQIGTRTTTIALNDINSIRLRSTGAGAALTAVQAGPWAVGTVLNGSVGDLGAGILQLGVVPIEITSAPYANFTFYLENLGASSATSGILLDTVFINPEPGTMALFGLGAAGLGGLVWRRRKAKPAAK